MSSTVKILALVASALAVVGGGIAYNLDPRAEPGDPAGDGRSISSSSSVACIDAAGRIKWAKNECPPGSTQVPNACDAGCCEPCPPDGCPPETVEALMCCPPICGEGSECFPIVETTGECPPGSILYECDYGITNADGSETCYIPPGS